MPYHFPKAEVDHATRRFGGIAITPVVSRRGVVNPMTSEVIVPPGQVEAVVFNMFDFRIVGTKKTVSFQFRLIPYDYPTRLPVFYLIAPRTFSLVPTEYTRMRPYPAIQPAVQGRTGDDPRLFGWDIDSSINRVHLCQVESEWIRRPIGARNLTWALDVLRGLLVNPLGVTAR